MWSYASIRLVYNNRKSHGTANTRDEAVWKRAVERVLWNVVNERFSSIHLLNKILWSEYKSNLENVCMCVCVNLHSETIEKRGQSANDWTNWKTENYGANKINTHTLTLVKVTTKRDESGDENRTQMQTLTHIHTNKCQWKWSKAFISNLHICKRDETFRLQKFFYSIRQWYTFFNRKKCKLTFTLVLNFTLYSHLPLYWLSFKI